MSTDHPDHEIQRLIDRHIDEMLSEAEHARLLEHVAEDKMAAQILIERYRLNYQIVQALQREQIREAVDPIDLQTFLEIEPEHVDLQRVDPEALAKQVKHQENPRELAQVEEDDSVFTVGVPGLTLSIGRVESGGIPATKLLTYAALLAVATIGIWIFLYPGPEIEERIVEIPQPTVENAATPPTALVINSANPVWEDGTIGGREELNASESLRLASGFIEVEFGRGARVLLEGPCEFEVIDDNSLQVASGRMVANVPPQAQLFSILTPSAKVIDFGTEFSVLVNPKGDTEVSVFNGLVEMHEEQMDDEHTAHHIALTAGQASRVDSELGLETQIKTFNVDQQSDFIRTIEDAGRPDIAYARLIQRLEPAAYWPMMGASPLNTASLRNRELSLTAVGHESLDRVEGPPILGDQAAPDDVLSIDAENAFYVAGPFESDLWEDNAYTIALWIKVSEHRSQNVVALIPNIRGRGFQYSNQLRIDDAGRLQHYTFLPAELNPELEDYATSTLTDDQPVDTDRWVHVAISFGRGSHACTSMANSSRAKPTSYVLKQATPHSSLVAQPVITIFILPATSRGPLANSQSLTTSSIPKKSSYCHNRVF